MAKKTLNVCPNCQGEFNLRDKGKCPHCNIALNLVREKQGRKSVLKYILGETPVDIPNVDEAKTSETTIAYGVEVTRLDEKRWHVVYKMKIERCVCPNCLKLQMNLIQVCNGHKVERKCDRCSHITLFEFRII